MVAASLKLLTGESATGKYIAVCRWSESKEIDLIHHNGYFEPAYQGIHISELQLILNISENFLFYYENARYTVSEGYSGNQIDGNLKAVRRSQGHPVHTKV